MTTKLCNLNCISFLLLVERLQKVRISVSLAFQQTGLRKYVQAQRRSSQLPNHYIFQFLFSITLPILESPNFCCTGFPTDWCTKVRLCTKKKFLALRFQIITFSNFYFRSLCQFQNHLVLIRYWHIKGGRGVARNTPLHKWFLMTAKTHCVNIIKKYRNL